MFIISFIIKRIASAIVILLALCAVLFILQDISHTNPIHAMLGAGATPQAVAAEKRRLGLDHPIVVQYFNYLDGILHGNLGISYRTRRPVAQDLATYLPATLELAFYSLIVAVLMGVGLGVMSAGNFKGSGLLKVVMVTGASVPQFLLAIGGLLLFFGTLHMLPATGRIGIANPTNGPTGFLTLDGIVNGRFGETIDAFKHLALPVLSIAVGPAVSIGRVLRSSLISAMESEYVKTAHMKGLSKFKVLTRHAIRNSLGPALSMTGLQAGLMFSGVVVVEDIFAWPGIGYYTAQSIPSGDFPAIAGVTLVLGTGYVIINAVVDLLQLVIDPRLRHLETKGRPPTGRPIKRPVETQVDSKNILIPSKPS